jgi:hypothetical protein
MVMKWSVERASGVLRDAERSQKYFSDTRDRPMEKHSEKEQSRGEF